MPIPPRPEPYRSPVIPNMGEFFGCEAKEIFDERDKAEGYQVGQLACKTLHDAIRSDHGHRSRAFQEAVLEGLRDNL